MGPATGDFTQPFPRGDRDLACRVGLLLLGTLMATVIWASSPPFNAGESTFITAMVGGALREVPWNFIPRPGSSNRLPWVMLTKMAIWTLSSTESFSASTSPMGPMSTWETAAAGGNPLQPD